MDSRATLVCTVYNEEATIRAFLDSLLAQSVVPDEVVIVDGGSNDGTVEIIREYERALNLRLISTPCNISQGRNIGIRLARNEVIAVTDAGVVLDKRWFENITRPFNDRSVDVVAGFYLPDRPKSLIQSCIARFTYRDFQSIDPATFLPSSRSIAFRKSVWQQVGGYPESLAAAEDTAFDLMLRRVGARFVFRPDAVVYWAVPKTFQEFFKKRFRYSLWEGLAGILVGKVGVIGRAACVVTVVSVGISRGSYWIFTMLGLALLGMAYLDLRRVYRARLVEKIGIAEIMCMSLVRGMNDLAVVSGFFVGVMLRAVRWMRRLFTYACWGRGAKRVSK